MIWGQLIIINYILARIQLLLTMNWMVVMTHRWFPILPLSLLPLQMKTSIIVVFLFALSVALASQPESLCEVNSSPLCNHCVDVAAWVAQKKTSARSLCDSLQVPPEVCLSFPIISCYQCSLFSRTPLNVYPLSYPFTPFFLSIFFV